MGKIEEKKNTHIVIKREDVMTLITADEALTFANILQKIEDKRYELGRKIRQSYYVVNKDEPYSDAIFGVIKKGELEKKNQKIEPISLDDLNFIIKLQNELNTQDTDHQADPRFWVVAQYEWQSVPDGCNESVQYYDSNAANTYESWKDLIKALKEDCDESSKKLKWNTFKNYDDLPDEIREYITEIPVSKVHVIKENTMFLTKKEAQKHIKLNYYHYNSTVHTYAMTAWRSPQVERLIKLLQTADFTSLILKEEK